MSGLLAVFYLFSFVFAIAHWTREKKHYSFLTFAHDNAMQFITVTIARTTCSELSAKLSRKPPAVSEGTYRRKTCRCF